MATEGPHPFLWAPFAQFPERGQGPSLLAQFCAKPPVMSGCLSCIKNWPSNDGYDRAICYRVRFVRNGVVNLLYTLHEMSHAALAPWQMWPVSTPACSAIPSARFPTLRSAARSPPAANCSCASRSVTTNPSSTSMHASSTARRSRSAPRLPSTSRFAGCCISSAAAGASTPKYCWSRRCRVTTPRCCATRCVRSCRSRRLYYRLVDARMVPLDTVRFIWTITSITCANYYLPRSGRAPRLGVPADRAGSGCRRAHGRKRAGRQATQHDHDGRPDRRAAQPTAVNNLATRKPIPGSGTTSFSACRRNTRA